MHEILHEYDQYLSFHPNYNLALLRDHRCAYIIGIDLAEGNGGDYSVINIFQVLPMSLQEVSMLNVYSDEYSFYKLVQVGMFRSNTVSVPDLAKYSYHLFTEVLNPDNIKIAIENNYEGNYYRQILTTLYGDNNDIEQDQIFIKFPYNMKDDQSHSMRIGIYHNYQSKEYCCKLMKDQVRNNQLILTEMVTINEALQFAKDPNKKSKGSYMSMGDNDDAIMTCVSVARARLQDDFMEMVDIVAEYISDDFHQLVSQKIGNMIDDDDIMDLYD